VVGALYDVAVGEVWPVDKIERLVSQAHAAGLKMEVIESVNIHDDIKIGLPSRDRYIANYQQTIRHLARFGVKVICYNFMPVFDWMKTDMNYVLPDGSLTMAFEKKDIDKRLEDVVKEVLENSNGFALPGWEPERLAEVQTLFAKYSAVDDHKLRENLVYFLQAVIPVCEEVG
jgi:mannonate dehydratase